LVLERQRRHREQDALSQEGHDAVHVTDLERRGELVDDTALRGRVRGGCRLAGPVREAFLERGAGRLRALVTDSSVDSRIAAASSAR
jgi:hypothetical protein